MSARGAVSGVIPQNPFFSQIVIQSSGPIWRSLEANMKLRSLREVLFATALLTALAASLHAQNFEYTKANYTKYKIYITIRDGVGLYTATYVQKNSAEHDNSIL